MRQPEYDPGLTQQFGAPLTRAINADGSFKAERVQGRRISKVLITRTEEPPAEPAEVAVE